MKQVDSPGGLAAPRTRLHDFIARHARAIALRSRVGQRAWPPGGDPRPYFRVPEFLEQLAGALQHKGDATPFASHALAGSATRLGAELAACGAEVAQVVRDFGDIRDAVTDVARDARIHVSSEERRRLHRCLDLAMAVAVTEYVRLAFQQRPGEAPEPGPPSTTRAVGGPPPTGRMDVADLIGEVTLVGAVHARQREVRFMVAPVESGLAVEGDAQQLASAVLSLLHNAFSNSAPGGTVLLRAHTRGGRVLIDVQDECGGAIDRQDPFHPFGVRDAADPSGRRLGLSAARASVRAHAGDVTVEDIPGQGSVLTIDLPLAE